MSSIGPGLILNGMKLYLDAANPNSYPSLDNTWRDISRRQHSSLVRNIALPLTDWTSVRRSVISEITDGSIEPPFDGARVWSCTRNNTLYSNTLHRMWGQGSQNGVLGELGQGNYRYYMWVRGKSTNNPTGTFQIDISDGAGSADTIRSRTIGNNEQWQLLSTWDKGGNYNAAKFFDFSFSGDDGDVFYVSSIHVVRHDVDIADDLVQLFDFPGYINYNETKKVYKSGILYNSPQFDSENKGSLTFDGVNDYIDINPYYYGNSTQHTAMVFFKITSYTGWQQIFQKGQRRDFKIRMSGFNSAKINLGYNTTDLGMLEYDSNEIQLNTWYFAAISIDTSLGGKFKCFVNDVKEYELDITQETTLKEEIDNSYAGELRIGNMSSNSENLTGNVSLVIMYERYLSDEEIIKNYEELKDRYN